MRHVSFIQNLDNLDAYLYSDRQFSNFLTIEIQSNLNSLRNGSYAAKSIECRNYKQSHTFSLIKLVLNKIIQFLTCHVLILSFGKILNHIKHFIEERYSFYSLSMDNPYFQDGRCNYLGPSWWGFIGKNRNLAQLKNKLKRSMGKNLKEKKKLIIVWEVFKSCLSSEIFNLCARPWGRENCCQQSVLAPDAPMHE